MSLLGEAAMLLSFDIESGSLERDRIWPALL